jgi:LEA14-like dessication related protein
MTKLRPGIFLSVLLVLILAGCSGQIFNGSLSVSVVDLKPTDASLLESRAILTVRYTNESIAPLGYSGSSHKLYLNGHYVGKGVANTPFGVPPLNSVTQDIPVQFENMALVRQMLDVGKSQVISYTLESVLFQTIAEDKFEIKTRAQGSLDLHAFTGATK